MTFENIETFNPRECVSGKLMRINRVTANIFRKYLKPFKITDSQLSLLFVLSKKNNLNQKQLAEMVKLEKSSLNRNLERLLANKLVTKEHFPLIQLSDKGKKLVNQIIPSWEKAMAEIKTLLEDDGINALNTLSQKLLK